MKAIFVLCASAILVQAISGQCTRYAAAPALPAASASYGCGNSLAAGLGNSYASAASNNAIVNPNGGSFPVSISSALAPSTVSVVSENNIQGSLAVEGQLPFLAAVALEGQVPSVGSGGVSYSCGDSNVGIVSQGDSSGAGLGYGSGLSYGAGVGSAYGAGYSAGYGGLSLGGYSSSGCGCSGY